LLDFLRPLSAVLTFRFGSKADMGIRQSPIRTSALRGRCAT
jgi:hypothetical protein